MTDMPDEIWAYLCNECPSPHIVYDYKTGATKYTRADKSPSPDAERLAKALRDCLNDIDGCEINMSNYGPDEVAAINNAYIQMYGAIENALADFEKGGLK